VDLDHPSGRRRAFLSRAENRDCQKHVEARASGDAAALSAAAQQFERDAWRIDLMALLD
jgi:hypothetical protein